MQYTNTFKKSFILAILLTLFSNVFSQNLTIESQSKSSLTLRLIIDNYDIKEIHEGNETMHEVALNSITIPNDKGKPNLPSVNRFIAIPNNSDARVVVNNCKKEILKNINIAPSRGIVSEYDTTNLAFIKDSDIYSKDELFPANIVSITDKMKLRGVDAVGLNISPIQYNPVKKELVVYTEIELSIEFEGENRSFGDDRLRSMYWDPILQHNILNYDVLPEIDYAERMQRWISTDAEGAEYLIIIPNDEAFREHAQRLADYRSKQGIITKVYSLSEMNVQSHDDLRDWFIEAYNNWEIAPVAVCLLGDYLTNTDFGIPAFIFDFNENETYISDRPYSDIDDDFLPDMTFTRLSAANIYEAEILVDKQIDYEFTNPVMDESFYDSPIITFAYEREKWFQISGETMVGYLRSVGKEPYRMAVESVFGCNYDPESWSSADNSEQIVSYFGPEGLCYIPAKPSDTEGYIEFDYNETPLLNKISDEPGYLLVNRDHGWFTIWGAPALSSKNLPSLTNHGKYPFMLSINCGSGAFDQDKCLIEEFIKYEDIGGVGGIAPTYETHTYTNDSYLWGVMDFFENDFLPDYGRSTEYNNNYLPAFANTSAKHFVYQQNFPNTYQNTRELTSNLFTAFCDAFLRLYSEVPQQMTIEHDTIYYFENNIFNIKAPTGSMIALSTKDNNEIKILAIAEGNDEMQTINILDNNIPDSIIYITVTKSNHLRYEESVIATTYVVVNELKSDNNINIHPNPAKETIKLSAVSCQLSAVKIYNSLGILVEEITVSSNEMEIDVSNYNPGLYFINIECNDKTISKKVVIE